MMSFYLTYKKIMTYQSQYLMTYLRILTIKIIEKLVVDQNLYQKSITIQQQPVTMSRIIIKNIPKNFTEKQIKDHFKNYHQQITDCKIARDDQGISRKFAFLGFKNSLIAQQIKKKYHNTYLGASKIQVDFAKVGHQIQNYGKNHQTAKKKIETKLSNKKFNQYKEIVKESSKKSWEGFTAPNLATAQQENQENQFRPSKIKSKKQMLSDKKQRKTSQIPPVDIKPIKPPKPSQKNKKYLNRPLNLDQSRLYITNLPYILEQTDFKKEFEKYGMITKVKLPKQYDGKTKGYGFITFEKQQEAMRAFFQLDKKALFGRIVHVKPALEDIGQIIKNGREADYEQKIKEKFPDGLNEEKTSYKKKKKREMRHKLNDTSNWNTLFLNPNTILERVSRKLKVAKAQILLSENLAPKVALAETQVIQETKEWMIKEGLNLSFMETDRNLCERSNRIILVKNLNYRIKEKDLRELFQFYGVVKKILLSSNRAIAIIEFLNSDYCKNAFEKLQNYKFKNNYLYLEYAPIGMIKEKEFEKKLQQIQEEIQNNQEISKVVYVKNLNFDTDDTSLHEFFQKIGPLKYAKIVNTNQGKSVGYGFVEFEKIQDAQKALKTLQSKILDGHKIIVTMSRKKVKNLQEIEKIKEKVKQIPKQQKKSKLSIKNLAFQANKKDVQQLFKQFGTVKTIRLPKKMDGSHRGFAFVEYSNVEDAALAKQALSNTHLYGRKLIIDYQKGTSTKKN